MQGLRGKVFQGGAMLLVRQFISMGLSLIGLLVITRVIGPTNYGPYVAALGICQYAQNIGQAGIAVFLVRKASEIDRRTEDVAFTMLLIFAALVMGVLEGLLGLIAAWTTMPAIQPILAVLLVSVFIQTVALVPAARLERDLDFKRVAAIETGGQLLYYALGVPLVFMGYGVWSLVIGWSVQQTAMCIAYHVTARYWPRLAWDMGIIRPMLRYAFGIAASDWLWQLRGLVNPLIVGHFLPAEAVGQIGLAIRMLELLTFTRAIAYRLSVAVLSKVQDAPAKLVAAATDATRLQTLALGPVLIGFSWFGGFILSDIFGPRWAPVMLIYPYLALSYLTNSQFNIHASILYVRHRNWDVSLFNIVHVAIFAAAAWVFVDYYGIVGYGFAELATLASYPVLHYAVRRSVGSPDYGIAAFWWASLAIGLFWRDLGVWAAAVPVVALLCPPSIRQLLTFYRMIVRTPEHAV